MTTQHIYNLRGKDFIYFHCTDVEEIDPMDMNAKYNGVVITPNGESFRTFVPFYLWKMIPNSMKGWNYHRFRVNPEGDIVNNTNKPIKK